MNHNQEALILIPLAWKFWKKKWWNIYYQVFGLHKQKSLFDLLITFSTILAALFCFSVPDISFVVSNAFASNIFDHRDQPSTGIFWKKAKILAINQSILVMMNLNAITHKPSCSKALNCQCIKLCINFVSVYIYISTSDSLWQLWYDKKLWIRK